MKIIPTALAFFMRFRHNPRMEPKPPDQMPNGAKEILNPEAKAIAEKIYTDWTAQQTPYRRDVMIAALHANAKDLVAGTLSKRATKGKGAANTLLLQLAAEFSPLAVLQITNRLQEIAARELKTLRVQHQIRKAQEP